MNSFIVNVSSEISWLNTWIKAHAQLHTKDFSNAIKTFRSLITIGPLKDSTSVLVDMAYCYHYLCENQKAISILQKVIRETYLNNLRVYIFLFQVIRLDPLSKHGKGLLSTLLAVSGNKDNFHAIESLIPTYDMSLWRTEDWVVIGNSMYALKKYDKAAYFAQQAYWMDRKYVEAILLKANALFQLKKYQDAANQCTEAIQICPYR